jgi:hypothetical protein
MRPSLARLATTTSLFVLALASISTAQVLEHPPLRVNIPFEFVAGDTTLPAGAYTLRAFLSEMEVISGKKNQIVTMAPPILEGAPGKRGLLIFHQVGDKYFLAEVWPAGSKIGRMIGGSATAKRRLDPAITSQVTVLAGQR